MEYMRAIILFFLIFAINTSFAGFRELTIHSRANCINNESIAWDATHNWRLRTTSQHVDYSGKYEPHYHDMDTGWEDTWRSAAVHWGEGNIYGDWYVVGDHYMDDGVTQKWIGETTANNCNIYDGWWDTPAPITA